MRKFESKEENETESWKLNNAFLEKRKEAKYELKTLEIQEK